MPPSPAACRSTSSAGARMPRSICPARSVPPASAPRRRRASSSSASSSVAGPCVGAHASASRTRSRVSGSAARAAAGRVGERVRDRGRGRDDRRLAEALRADVRQVRVGDVDEVDHDLGHVGDGRQLVVVEVRVDRDAGRRVDDELLGERERHALQHAALDLARGGQRVDDPPDVVHGDDPLDAHLAECRGRPRPARSGSRTCGRRTRPGSGPREPEPSIVASPSFSVTSVTATSSAPSRERMRPSRTSRSSAAISNTSPASCEQRLAHLRRRRAHGGHHRRRRLRAARDRAVDVRAPCRRRRRARASSGRPSSSAATICAAVSVPVPMSWMPGHDERRGRRASRRTVACDGGPPPPHQIWVAQPMPRSRPSALRLAQRVARRPSRRARRRGRSRRAGACSSTAARSPGRRRRGCARRSSSGSRSSASASSSIACSNTVVPSITPGARNAFCGAQVRLQRERHARARRRSGRACSAGIEHREHPAALPHRDHGVGVDRGERAVAARAEAYGLARRSAAAAVELLGVPVVDEPHRPAGDRAPARPPASASKPAPCLAPKPPPTNSVTHAHVVLAQPERRGELVAGREHALRRDPGGELVAVPRGDRRVRLERRLQLRRASRARARP